METPHCLYEARAVLGEGPVWMPEESALFWVDIKTARLYRTAWPSGETRIRILPEALCCFAPRRAGGFVGAFHSSLAFFDDIGNRMGEIDAPETDKPGNRFNDGKAGPLGAFWFGSMNDGEREPTGALYRLTPDGQWAHMDVGGAVTNGPAFAPDGRTLYFTDTHARTIHAYDFSMTGDLTNRRTFLTLTGDQGFPDGMTVDARGHLWVASFGGGCVFEVSPEGVILGKIDLPVPNVTSCAFGGPDMEHLFITTARLHLSPEEDNAQRLGGGLFVVHTGHQGLPAFLFEG